MRISSVRAEKLIKPGSFRHNSMTRADNYYEGILQLRQVSQEVLDYVERRCKEEQAVSSVREFKEGFDFYITSNKFLNAISKELRTHFTGEIKNNYTLHTRDRQHNKDIYRMTVLFREVPVKKGDVLQLNGIEYIVTGVGNKVLLKERKTGKKTQCTFEYVHRYAQRD